MNSTTPVLSRIPTTVFLLLGKTREYCHQSGMVGCGLQLDDHGEILWSEVTVSVTLTRSVCTFLRLEGIPFSLHPRLPSVVRLSITEMERYLSRYEDIKRFLDAYDRNRFLRLGSRAFKDPWDLDSRDCHVLLLTEEVFIEHFIADPRGRPLASVVASRVGRHSPVMYRELPGVPPPGVGSWI